MSRIRTMTRPLGSKLQAGGTHNIVFIGGSVMNGAVATTGNGFRERLQPWLEKVYPQCTFTFHNITDGGTAAWWRHFRIVDDIVPLSPAPTVIFTDSINEVDSALLFPASYEAMIRRLRTAFPNTPLIATQTIRVTATDGSDNTFTTEWYDAQRDVSAILRHYDVPSVNWGAAANFQLQRENTDYDPPSIFMGDTIHPNDEGHERLFTAVRGMFSSYATPNTANVWEAIGDYPVLGDATAVGELATNTPRKYLATELSLGAGWSLDGTDAICSTTDAVATLDHSGEGFTARSFGLQSDDVGATVEVRVDGGAWSSSITLNNTPKVILDFGDNVTPPVIDIRRKTGAVRIEKVLWL